MSWYVVNWGEGVMELGPYREYVSVEWVCGEVAAPPTAAICYTTGKPIIL